MKKTILKILGVLFSAVIIASVFLPYGKNGVPLFTLDSNNEIILPILIMVFGVLSIILYLFSKHREFAISTSGAILFFVIIEAVYAISNKTFNEFYLGYYALAGGSVLLFFNTIIILFVKDNKVEKEETVTQVEQPVDLVTQLNSTENKPVEQTYQTEVLIQPVMEQPIEFNQPIMEQPVVQQPVQFEQPVVQQPIQFEEPVVQQPIEFNQPIQELQPIADVSNESVVSNPLPEIQFDQMPEYKEPIKPIYEEPKEVKPEENPALQSLFEPTPVVEQPVVEQPQNTEYNPSVNPVLQEFDQPMSFVSQPVQPVNPVQQPTNTEEEIGMNIFNNH